MKLDMRHRVLVTLFAGLLTATACGGSAGTTTPSASGGAAASQDTSPVKVAIVVGVTGSQAPSSANWIAGLGVAVDELNAQGGILGRKIETFTLDTRSDPATSVASMKSAIEQKPYVVMGTILSSATLVNFKVLEDAGIPQFTGSVSPDITTKNSPKSLFRTEPNSNDEAAMFASWVTNQSKSKKIAIIYANDEFGTTGQKSFADLFGKQNATVAASVSTAVGQADFSGEIAKLQQSGADTVFMYMHETESGRFLQQAQSAGLSKSMALVGASSALAASTLQLAGPAADGLKGFVPYSASAKSMQALAQRYLAKNPSAAPDHNFFKGYMAMWTVAYVTKELGKFDQAGLVSFLHDKTMCVDKYPNLLESTYWSKVGDIDRSTFVVSVKDGKQTVTDTIPPLQKDKFSSCKG